MIEYKGYIGKVVDLEDGVLHGRVVNIRDVVTFEAKSAKELELEFRKSVDVYIETCIDKARTGLTLGFASVRPPLGFVVSVCAATIQHDKLSAKFQKDFSAILSASISVLAHMEKNDWRAAEIGVSADIARGPE